MFARVLVPLDGSSFAESALPLATAVSRAAGASLDIVSAYDPLPPPSAGPEEAAGLTVPAHVDTLGAIPVTAGEMRESLRDERTTYLRDIERRVREVGGVDAEVALMEGRADRAIIERAESTGADLVVMATHGRGAVERAWLGSVADRVVRELTVPILLIRPVDEEAIELSPPPVVSRVVVTLDGSHLAEAVVEPAVSLAAALGVPVALLRVVGTRVDIGSTYIPHAAQEYSDHLEADREEATAYLRGMAERLAGRDVVVADTILAHGPAARGILDSVDVDGGDIIAMATHGRGGLRRLVLGSVSDKVVRAAVGPVLLVRPRDKKD
jgi:nucleotide-binding universal stress UspA family protein